MNVTITSSYSLAARHSGFGLQEVIMAITVIVILALSPLILVSSHRVSASTAVAISEERCDTRRFEEFILTECKTELGELSQKKHVTSGTTCSVRCKAAGWSPNGWRKCVNGRWEGNVISCQGTLPVLRSNEVFSVRVKRACYYRRHCSGWWWGRRCHNRLSHCTPPPAPPPPLPTIRCPSISNIVQYAARGETSTRVAWGSPVASSGSGSLSISRTKGLPAYSLFGIGRHDIEYRVRDSRGSTSYCTFFFIVAVKKCSSPVNPAFGKVHCPRYPVVWGDTCTYSCNTGYTRDGTSAVTCEENRSFNPPAPTCNIVKCTTPPAAVTSGAVECPAQTVYNTRCTIQCPAGYAQQPLGDYSCNEFGVWLGSFSCKDVTPPVFAPCPPNIIKEADRAKIDTFVQWQINATDNSGSVSLSQTRGPANATRLNIGSYNVSYLATDGVNLDTVCDFTITVKGLICTPPEFVALDSNMASTCTTVVVGGVCDILCLHSTVLKGDSNITCEKDNSIEPKAFWKYNALPYCDAKTCDNLDPPGHGAVACDKLAGGSTYCTVQCTDTFDHGRNVDKFHYCRVDGTWTGTLPIKDCVRKRRGSAASTTSELYLYSGSCEDVKDEIRNNFRAKVILDGTCRGDCTIDNIRVFCGEARRKRKRRGIIENRKVDHLIKKRSLELIVLAWEFKVDYNINETIEVAMQQAENQLNTVKTGIKAEITNGNYDNLGVGVETDKSSLYFFETDIACDLGQTPNYDTNTCRGCPTGTMYSSVIDGCLACPIGHYQDEDGSLQCKSCPAGTTTAETGSRLSENCIAICSPGEYSPNGILPCSPCDLGTFQPDTKSTSCLTCPAGQTTLSGEATDISLCEDYEFIFENVGFIRSEGIVSNVPVTKFSLVVLLKIEELSVQGMTIELKQGTATYLNINIKEQTTLDVNGVSTSVSSIMQTWWYVIVTVNPTQTTVTTYSHGQQQSTGQISAGTSIGVGTFLHLQSSEGDRVILKYLRIIPGIITNGNIESIIATCGLLQFNPVLSLDIYDHLLITDVLTVSPSTCDVINDCVPSPCGIHTCINKVSGYTCQCSDGYTGINCAIPPDYCLHHVCKNGGSCISSTLHKNYTCSCSSGFKGALCDYEIVNGGWSDWSILSECNVTCNGGIATRERTCTNPLPDVDGRPCVGESTESLPCSTQPCPDCKIADLLHHPTLNRIECTGTSEALNCTPICATDLIYTSNMADSYQCLKGEWSPGIRPLPCTKNTIPSIVKAVIQCNYTVDDCSAVNGNDVNNQMNTVSSPLPCIGDAYCHQSTVIQPCQDNLLIVEIIFNIHTQNTQYGLEHANQILDDTSNILGNDTSLFDLTINGNVIPTVVDATETWLCPDGSVFDNESCVLCSPGTYFSATNTTACQLCEMGKYQPDRGTTTCLPCPAGFSTPFMGSFDVTSCSVPTAIEMLLTASKK